MIAAASYVVFQHQSGRYPFPKNKEPLMDDYRKFVEKNLTDMDYLGSVAEKGEMTL